MEFPPRSVAITQVADCGVRAVGAAQLNSRPMVKGERFLSDVRHVAHHLAARAEFSVLVAFGCEKTHSRICEAESKCARSSMESELASVAVSRAPEET
jgi:hypothetical protein